MEEEKQMESHPSLNLRIQSVHPSLQVIIKEGHASLEYVVPEPQPEEPLHEEPQAIQIQNLPDFQQTFQPIVAELQRIRSEFTKLNANSEKRNSLRDEVLQKLNHKLENV
jgi:hypothetical protein